MRYRHIALLLALLLLACWSLPVQAANVLTTKTAEDGFLPLATPYFQDQTNAHSVPQAQAQFSNQHFATTLPGIDLGTQAGNFWVNVTVQNNTHISKWLLELPGNSADHLSPIKSVAVYDPAHWEDPVAIWPDVQGQMLSHFVASLVIPENQTVTRYLFIETWPGVQNTITPMLKTPELAASEAMEDTQKASLLWLVIGAVCGAGLVQLLLTRQVVQGFLALNALLLTVGFILLKRPELIPGLIGFHPIFPPLIAACIIGIGASLILWVAGRPYAARATWSVIPLVLNIAVLTGGLLAIDTMMMRGFSAEDLPTYVFVATGLLLLVVTLAMSLKEVLLLWYVPAWLILIAMPWVMTSHYYLIVIAYMVALACAGVSSVFSFWNSMHKETEALQKRLRLDLKNVKQKHEEDNKGWERKMEGERILLNELRHREQQRSAELELARKEADTANKAKSDFLAIISHEIRTPMNGIMGVIDLMRMTPLNEEQHEYVDVVKNSGDTMVTLLNDILDYSKIEKGAIDLEVISFALRPLVKSVATLMTGRAQDKNLPIRVEIATDVPDNLRGDPSRIRQILLNLVSNAIKFTETGNVTIKVTRDRAQNEFTLLFEIVDTGIGISALAQEKLFQPYVQADASISRRFGGTGLGLNICRMLVDAMKGQIGARSREHEGSTMWFTLPLQVTEHSMAENKSDIRTMRTDKHYTILVIDDNVVNLRVTKGLLESDGHFVVTTDKARNALQLIKQNNFDVIFVDMMMPDMTGSEFIIALRQDIPHADIPVIALTGLNDEQSRQDIAALKIMGTIVKPTTKQALQDMLENLNQATVLPHAETADLLNIPLLTELRTSLPLETLNELFIDLTEKAKELAGQMTEAAEKSDMKDLNEKAHNLKGMAGNFGLQSLMVICGEIENLARNNKNQEAISLTRNIPDLSTKTFNALDHWIKAR